MKEIKFPNDEDIIKKMNKASRFKFNPKDIIKKVFLGKSKNNKLFLYIAKPVELTNVYGENTYTNSRIKYYVVNSSGDIVGWLVGYTLSHNTIEIEYCVNPKFQGKGIGTIMLKSVLYEIFKLKCFDNLPFSNFKTPNIKTRIDKICLSINSDNYPSIKVAKNNGFSYSESSTFYELTLEEYIKLLEPIKDNKNEL